MGRLDHRAEGLPRELLHGRLRWNPPHPGHLHQLPHARDRGVPEDGPDIRDPAVLRPAQVLQHEHHLLRTGQQHNQERSAEDGGRAVRLPVSLLGLESDDSQSKMPFFKTKTSRKEPNLPAGGS